MNHTGRDMSLEHIGFQITDPAAAHSIQEIRHVSAAAVTGELLDLLAVIVVGPASAATA